MDRMGQRLRLDGHAKCTLHLEGLDYDGEIENISLGGILVKLINGIPHRALPGSTCGLRLCGTQDANPVEYTCRVARLSSSVMGMQILELNYWDTTL
jgi:c-di-GMP-binding flagellar brake protein YcgR